MTLLAQKDGVAIRRLRIDDLRAFQAYRNDPEVGRWQGWSAMSDDQARGFLDAVSGGPLLPPGAWNQLAIADATTDRLIGDLGVFHEPKEDEVEVGITLARDAQGRGKATTALRLAFDLVFRESTAQRVICISDQRNLPSLALLNRVGMRHVETLAAEFNGAPCKEEKFELSRG